MTNPDDDPLTGREIRRGLLFWAAALAAFTLAMLVGEWL
jgi:hypothetical protein